MLPPLVHNHSRAAASSPIPVEEGAKELLQAETVPAARRAKVRFGEQEEEAAIGGSGVNGASGVHGASDVNGGSGVNGGSDVNGASGMNGATGVNGAFDGGSGVNGSSGVNAAESLGEVPAWRSEAWAAQHANEVGKRFVVVQAQPCFV